MLVPKEFLAPTSKLIENTLTKYPLIFTLVVLYQGLFAGNAITIPRNLKVYFEMPAFRFASLMMIAITASQDVEVAFVSVIVFLLVIYAFKTPVEREDSGFI
jgi:hypothetical protein